MTSINQLINAFIILTSAGGGFRIVMLLFQIVAEPDIKESNIKKIRNVCLFMILSLLVLGMKGTIVKYYQ